MMLHVKQSEVRPLSSPEGFLLSHEELARRIQREALLRRWRLEEPKAYQKGADLAASWAIELPHCHPPSGYRFSLGVVNSLSGRSALSLYGGLTQEDRGFVLARWYLGRHTEGLLRNLTSLLSRSFQQYANLAPGWGSLLERWQRREVSEKELAAITTLLGSRSLLPWSRIGQALKVYGGLERPNRWELYRALAEQAGRNPPLKQIGSLWGIFQVLSSKE